MKLAHVTLENFRAVQRLDLPLHPQLTVLVGENGAGKTSILEGLAEGLKPIADRYPGVKNGLFDESDIRQTWPDNLDPNEHLPARRAKKQPYSRISLATTTGLLWDRTRPRDKAKQTHAEIPKEQGRHKLYEYIDPVIYAIQEGKPESLPIFLYYGIERNAPEIPKRQRDFEKAFDPFKAQAGALQKGIRLKGCMEWFIEMQNFEREIHSKQRNFDFRLPILESVRLAIENLLPNCKNPRTETHPPKFIVDFSATPGKAEELQLDQLSGGYKIMLALVMDIARRLGQANSHRDNPCDAEAIVLIDEVELHLHPRWQQHVLVDLIRVFPNVQFIVTTHSDQVLTTVHPENIVILRRDNTGIVAESAHSSYGAETHRVLSEILGVESRPPAEYNEFTRILGEYWRLIEQDQGESDDALQARENLEKLSASDPILIRADMEIRRRRALRQKRGVA